MPDRTRSPAGDPVRGLDALRTMLDSAGQLVTTLLHDPFLPRLIAAFQTIPTEDRETILGIIERDVAMRRADTDGSGRLMGMHNVRPNPNARLYVRVVEPDTGDTPYLAVEELVLAITRAARVTHRVMLTTSGDSKKWRDTVMTTFQAMPPDELAAVAWCMRAALAVVEHIDASRKDLEA
ncbi:MAG TPA: hypothetical protein VGR62_01665 [Candidatus Binatia bacterium]|jgi:hypothetical protein|nr:hypothetical protein [Candidatus Binatia bacterium]